MGGEAVSSTPEQFAEEIKVLVKLWPPVVKAAAFRPSDEAPAPPGLTAGTCRL
jgi:hypothetical protein